MISQMAFWYILNLYGKLHLLVKKFLQKDQFQGPKKEKKNVDFATVLKFPHFLQPDINGSGFIGV